MTVQYFLQVHCEKDTINKKNQVENTYINIESLNIQTQPGYK